MSIFSGKHKEKLKDSPDEMSFWNHLEALRWHFIRSAIAIVALATLALIYNEFIFDEIILKPKDPNFITNRLLCWFGQQVNINYFCNNNLDLNIINTEMSGQVTTSIWVALVAGLIIAVPYVLWEFWRFIKPALNPREKRYTNYFVLVTSSLFLIGILFSYFLIVPLTLNFLGSYKVSATVMNYFALDSYISTVTTLTFATGLVFEFPVLVYFLTRIGIITPAFLSKQRRYIIVIILIIGAIITPPDVFSQVMVSIPLYGLYEGSIFISRAVYNKRKQKEITEIPA